MIKLNVVRIPAVWNMQQIMRTLQYQIGILERKNMSKGLHGVIVWVMGDALLDEPLHLKDALRGITHLSPNPYLLPKFNELIIESVDSYEEAFGLLAQTLKGFELIDTSKVPA